MGKQELIHAPQTEPIRPVIRNQEHQQHLLITGVRKGPATIPGLRMQNQGEPMFREQLLRTAGPIHDPAQEPGTATAGLPRLLQNQVIAGLPAAAVQTEVILLLQGAVRTAAILHPGAPAGPATAGLRAAAGPATAHPGVRVADHLPAAAGHPAAVAQDLPAAAEGEADNIIQGVLHIRRTPFILFT